MQCYCDLYCNACSYSVLIEDGTSGAMVYCRQNNVWNLLNLNKDQEMAVESLVKKHGEIVLDQVEILGNKENKT